MKNSIFDFRKFLENKSDQTEKDTNINNQDNKVKPDDNQKAPSKKYYFEDKIVDGIIQGNQVKFTELNKSIKKEEAIELGEKIKNLNDVKDNFFYIHEVKPNQFYRIVKVLEKKAGKLIVQYKEKDEIKKIEISFNTLFKMIPEKEGQKSTQSQKEKTNLEKEIEKSNSFEEISAKIPKIEDKISKYEQEKEKKVKWTNEDGEEEEISLGEAIKRLKQSKESQKKNESLSYRRINEEADDDNSVSKIWESFFSDWDRKQIHRLTQRDRAELLEGLNNPNMSLSLDVSKNPDPIVGICRIFERAHQLYFNDVIPSGRPGGRVSQKTFREYIKLGTGSKARPESQEEGGPYAVKSIFNKWRKGVLKIIQDQQYRKIFANVNFIVPGAKDTFNKVPGEGPEKTGEGRGESRMVNLSSRYKIFERDGDRTLERGTSTGQILFEFMMDMINPKKLDDFETAQGELLNKYFGIDTKKVKIPKVEAPQKKRKPTKDDIDPDYLVWKGYGKLSDIQSEKFESGNYVALIFKDDNGNDVLVFFELSKDTNPGSTKFEIENLIFSISSKKGHNMGSSETFLTRDIGTKTNFKLQEFSLDVTKEKCKLNNKEIEFKDNNNSSGYRTYQGTIELKQNKVILDLKEKGATNEIKFEPELEKRAFRKCIVGELEAYFFVLVKYDETDEMYKPFKLP